MTKNWEINKGVLPKNDFDRGASESASSCIDFEPFWNVGSRSAQGVGDLMANKIWKEGVSHTGQKKGGLDSPKPPPKKNHISSSDRSPLNQQGILLTK